MKWLVHCRRDTFCHHILHQIRKGKQSLSHIYKIKSNILKHHLILNGQIFYPIVLPHMMIGHVLELGYNKLGHNGIGRTYAMLKKTLLLERYESLHYVIFRWFPMPNYILTLLLFLWNLSVWILLVNFIHLPNRVTDMLLLWSVCLPDVFCVPLKTKQVSEVLQACIDNIYAKFGGSLKVLSDNGTEFKNILFEKIAKELGVKHEIYTAPYWPSSNGHIEGFHNFLNVMIWKNSSLPNFY